MEPRSNIEKAKDKAQDAFQDAKESTQSAAKAGSKEVREAASSGLDTAESKIRDAKKEVEPEKTWTESISDGLTSAKDSVVETFNSITGRNK